MKTEKRGTGRIAERIVANEFEARDFLVRDLNREGTAANADLLVAKDGFTWFVQVKGCRYDHASDKGDRSKNLGWWFHYGYCTDEHISRGKKMFNHVEQAFIANVVVFVCIRKPNDYQCIVMPVCEAEKAAQINLNYDYRTPKKADGSKKTGSIVWAAFYIPRTTLEKAAGMREEQKILGSFLAKSEDAGKDMWMLDPAWGSSSQKIELR